MTIYAGLDSNNMVFNLVDIPEDHDADYENYIANTLNMPGTWKKAFWDINGKKRFCGIGYLYMEEKDAFIPPKPLPSWVLNDENIWNPPTPHPEDGVYTWNEETISWLKVEIA
jgi:hypothetical protein